MLSGFAFRRFSYHKRVQGFQDLKNEKNLFAFGKQQQNQANWLITKKWVVAEILLIIVKNMK